MSVKSIERNAIARGHGVLVGAHRPRSDLFSRSSWQNSRGAREPSSLRRRSLQSLELSDASESDLEILDSKDVHEEALTDRHPEDPAHEFLAALEKYAKEVDSPPHSISGGALSTEDVASDISFGVRMAGPLMGPSSAAYDSLGHTTSENLFLGFYSAYKAFRRFVRAKRIADTPGMVEEGVAMVRGGTQGMGGATFFAYRNMSIASQLTQAEVSMTSSSALGVATFAVGVVGSLFFTALYALVGVWSGWHLCRSLKMRTQLSQGDDSAKISFLFQQIHSNTRTKLSKLKRSTQERTEQFKAKLRETCMNEFVYQFYAWQKAALARGETLERVFSEEEIREKFEVFFERINGNAQARTAYSKWYLDQMELTPEDVEGFEFTPMELCGLKLFEHQRQLRKEARLTRWLGSRAVEQIKKAYQHGLDIRVTEHSNDVVKAEVAEVLKAVRGEVDRQILIQGIGTLIGGLGVTTTLIGLGFVALPVFVNMALIASTFLLIALMLGMDVYFMHQGLESGRPGPHDRKFIILIAGIMLASLTLSVALTAGFALPIFPLIMTLLGGGAILGVCAYSYYKLGRLEKKWKEDHPEISRLIDASSHEERLELYKKLSKEDRNALRAHDEAFYKEHQATFKPTVIGYLSNLEQGKEGTSPDFLLKALKRMGKQLWAKWHYSHNLEDRELAKAFQEIVDSIHEGDYTALNRLSKTQQAELHKNLFVLIKRHEFKDGFKYTLQGGKQVRQEPLIEEGAHMRRFLYEVFYQSHYDLSFDPRAAEDGLSYWKGVPMPPPSLAQGAILENLSNKPSRASLKENLIELKKREYALARASFFGFVRSPSEWNDTELAEGVRFLEEIGIKEQLEGLDPRSMSTIIFAAGGKPIRAYDHFFISQIEEVYRILFPKETLPRVWLHSPLFLAIYAIRQPQDRSWRPGANADLGRNLSWATELQQGNPANRQAEFMENTHSSALYLIHSMRRLREVIRTCPLEEMSPEDIELLKQSLKDFKVCWDRYIHSDPLLQKANRLFSGGKYGEQTDALHELTLRHETALAKMQLGNLGIQSLQEAEQAERETTELYEQETKVRESLYERIRTGLDSLP